MVSKDTRTWLLVSGWCATFMAILLWAPAQPSPVVEALFIFYQPILCFLVMLWLWAILVHFFESNQVRYEACFASEHLRHLLSGPSLKYIASVFTTVTAVSASVFIFSASREHFTLASYQPTLLYVILWTLLMNPLDFVFDSLHAQQRWFFLDTLRRVVLPFQVCMLACVDAATWYAVPAPAAPSAATPSQ
jgi:EXS family